MAVGFNNDGDWLTCLLDMKQVMNAINKEPGRDISFPTFTRKKIETKIIRKEIKTIISRLNDLK